MPSVYSQDDKWFGAVAEVSVHLKQSIEHFAAVRECQLADDQREALHAISHNIGRILSGGHAQPDDWLAISACACFVADRLKTAACNDPPTPRGGGQNRGPGGLYI